VLGEALFGTRRLTGQIASVIAGTVLFRALVAAALQSGLDPNALKLLTAAFVLAVLAVPGAVRRVVARRALRRRTAASRGLGGQTGATAAAGGAAAGGMSGPAPGGDGDLASPPLDPLARTPSRV
jgi:hypothetical protein